jgi:hypothetical protein
LQVSPTAERSDGEENEIKVCDSLSYDSWKGLVKNGNGHPVIGHQLSALLAQNGQLGGNAAAVSFFLEMTRSIVF